MIKACGDFDAQKYNINSDMQYLEQYPKMKRFLERIQGWNKLVVGYDTIWDQHLFSTIFTRGEGDFWYINQEQTEKDSALSLHLQGCDAKRIEGVEGVYIPFFINL